jgi:hypothetical protein
MTNLLAYLAQQASLTGLPNLPSQLTHLSSSGAQLSAHQISKVIYKLYDQPVGLPDPAG